MISVSSQGPGRPFLLTKYRGGFFSPCGGPVFGRVLYKPGTFHQKERRGWRDPRRIQADESSLVKLCEGITFETAYMADKTRCPGRRL